MNTLQFELVEDPALTTSGFELRVNVASFTSKREGEISITSGCATFGELDTQISRLVNELEQIRTYGETRFAEGPFGPSSLQLDGED